MEKQSFGVEGTNTNMEAEITEKTEPWHKPKNGSVYPVKGSSVKKMIWDRAVQLITDKGSKRVPPPPAASNSRKNHSVHPCSS